MWNTVNKKWPNVNLWQEWVPVSQTITTFSDFSKCDQGIQSEILLQRFNTLFSVTDDEHVVISIDRSVVGHRDVHGSSLQTHVTELLRKLVVLSLQPQAVGNWKCWQANWHFPSQATTLYTCWHSVIHWAWLRQWRQALCAGIGCRGPQFIKSHLSSSQNMQVL